VTIKSDDKSVTIKSVTIKSDDNKKAIIDYLTENESGKNSDLAQLLGVKSTRVKQLIYKLIEDDIIVTEGANRNRVYKLKSKDN
jgi:Mn-dependent DtxR family transcriptional regulator